MERQNKTIIIGILIFFLNYFGEKLLNNLITDKTMIAFTKTYWYDIMAVIAFIALVWILIKEYKRISRKKDILIRYSIYNTEAKTPNIDQDKLLADYFTEDDIIFLNEIKEIGRIQMKDCIDTIRRVNKNR